MATTNNEYIGRHTARIEALSYDETVERMREDALRFVGDTALQGGPFDLVCQTSYGDDRCKYGPVEPMPVRIWELRNTIYGSYEPVRAEHCYELGLRRQRGETGSLCIDKQGEIRILTRHDHGSNRDSRRLGGGALHASSFLNAGLVDEPKRLAEVYQNEWLHDLEKIRRIHLGLAKG